jgi:hypothetical protein
MRLEYLLPLSLATLSCAASENIARRVATPIEDNTDEAIRELQLSPRDRQAVFGDTGEHLAVHHGRPWLQAKVFSNYQAPESDRLSCLNIETTRRSV